jgi:prepilin-type N-terminal cleavage/methylation domain-containing protein
VRVTGDRGGITTRTCSKMSKHNSRRGFTLVEIIITLGLLAVIAAMGAPRLQGALRRRITQTAADQFVTAHSLARGTAIRYGRVAQLHIDPATTRFWVDVDTSANGVGQRATIWYERSLTRPNLVMTSNRSLLCFDARGLPLVLGACEAGDATIIFTAIDKADTVRTAVLGKVLR